MWLLLIPFFYQNRENDLQKKKIITCLADARDATRHRYNYVSLVGVPRTVINHFPVPADKKV